MTIRVMPGASRASPAATVRTAPMSWSAGRVLEQEAAGAGPKGFEEVLLVRPNVVSTRTRVPAVGLRRGEVPGGVDAVEDGHPDVHDHDVGRASGGHLDGLRAVACTAHDVHVRLWIPGSWISAVRASGSSSTTTRRMLTGGPPAGSTT